MSVDAERVILAAAVVPSDDFGPEGPLTELGRLVKTAGARVVGKLVQRLPRYDASSYLGSGKVEQLEVMAREREADTIVCDNDLSPAQIRNLERIIDRKVIDRSELILDIFAKHARTQQAKLQVELAQLEYTLPRLTRMWKHLSRIEGGIGFRGPGERQLEVERRLVRKKTSELRKRLKQIGKRKARQVAARSDEFTISIIGYTNAGKSTLMNRLTNAGVEAGDQLFVTLDTRTREWHLSRTEQALLSDTVGFIRRLPHHLVASFHATLEEANRADLLLHVVDISHEDPRSQVQAVKQVLREIGAADKPELTVFNKIDQPHAEAELALLRSEQPWAVAVSALNSRGIDQLHRTVLDYARNDMTDVEILTNCGNGRLFAMLAQSGRIIRQEYSDDKTRIIARVHRHSLTRIEALNDGIPAKTLA